MKVNNEFKELGVAKGTYQATKKSDVLEVAIGDTVPVVGTGVLVRDGEARNFDGNGSKVWVRSVYGEADVNVVLGFL
ncbi:MAG: hypothetical protein ACRC0F_00150 [Cetobacterium sp.]